MHLRNLIFAHPVTSNIVIDLRKVLFQKRTAFASSPPKIRWEVKPETERLVL
jgi:hypothetical protein